jgi:hypothetical protein
MTRWTARFFRPTHHRKFPAFEWLCLKGSDMTRCLAHARRIRHLSPMHVYLHAPPSSGQPPVLERWYSRGYPLLPFHPPPENQVLLSPPCSIVRKLRHVPGRITVVSHDRAMDIDGLRKFRLWCSAMGLRELCWCLMRLCY